MKHVAFLDKYIPKWRELRDEQFLLFAARNSINASVARNKTYRSGVSKHEREEMRDSWIQYLIDWDFERITEWKEWEGAILELRSMMNEEFPSVWLNNFRISHAQKSLSVFWKYKYCRCIALGQICPAPVSMPLDRIVQNRSALPINEIISWGAIDSIEKYTKQIEKISRRVNRRVDELFNWEIENF